MIIGSKQGKNREEAISLKKKIYFFFFREDPELAKYNILGLFSAGAKGPTHLNRP